MNFWDERYRHDRYFYGEAPNRFLEAQSGIFPSGGRLLGLGEGEGRNAVFLAGQGFQVTALDQSPVGLDKALRLAERHGVALETRNADLLVADLGQAQWDGIYNIFCHLPDRERQALHPRIRQALKPGGIFLTEQFEPRQLTKTSGGPPDLDLLPQLTELERAFSGWRILVARYETTPLDEGPKHQGEAHVVRFIAQKPDDR